jgi:hypothetical protein
MSKLYNNTFDEFYYFCGLVLSKSSKVSNNIHHNTPASQ